MNGERMKGKWVLIRMRDDKHRPGTRLRHNWLLIKRPTMEPCEVEATPCWKWCHWPELCARCQIAQRVIAVGPVGNGVEGARLDGEPPSGIGIEVVSEKGDDAPDARERNHHPTHGEAMKCVVTSASADPLWRRPSPWPN
jgi:hypothetical protein